MFIVTDLVSLNHLAKSFAKTIHTYFTPSIHAWCLNKPKIIFFLHSDIDICPIISKGWLQTPTNRYKDYQKMFTDG